MLALTHDNGTIEQKRAGQKRVEPKGSGAKQKDNMLRGLFRDCIYGICLRLKKQVLATHQELVILRRCADLLRDQSNRMIYVVATANKQKTNFIINTLMHLGVSCGQIKLSPVGSGSDKTGDIWLFVADR